MDHKSTPSFNMLSLRSPVNTALPEKSRRNNKAEKLSIDLDFH